MTTRRLSTEIEYSQPVIYKHFASMEDLVEAIALEGFGELAAAARRRPRRAAAEDELGAVARAYVAFADREPSAVRRHVHPRHATALRRRGSRPRCPHIHGSAARPSPRSPATGTSKPSPKCSGPRCTDSSRSAATTVCDPDTTPTESTFSSPSSAPQTPRRRALTHNGRHEVNGPPAVCLANGNTSGKVRKSSVRTGPQEYEAYLRIGPVSERYYVESSALLAGHDGTATTESVCRHEVRPALT